MATLSARLEDTGWDGDLPVCASEMPDKKSVSALRQSSSGPHAAVALRFAVGQRVGKRLAPSDSFDPTLVAVVSLRKMRLVPSR